MDDHYPNVARLLFGQPWAIERSKFEEIKAAFALRRAGQVLSEAEIRAVVGRRRDRPSDHGFYDPEADAIFWAGEDGVFRAANGEPAVEGRQVIAVLGIYGTIVPRASLMAETSGLTSTERIAARLSAAVNNPAVRGIVLDVDSPGGNTFGAIELATKIREAREQKTVDAVANFQALSLAYWYASQASSLTASPSSLLGSIGVFAEHEDLSGMLEQEGRKVTLISYGENKTLGNPYEPLSDEALSHIQGLVDGIGQAFEADVAKGRKVGKDVVRKRYGQGLMFGAKEAVERGMADRVGTLEEAVRRVAGRKGDAPPVAAAAPDAGIQAAAIARLGSLRS